MVTAEATTTATADQTTEEDTRTSNLYSRPHSDYCVLLQPHVLHDVAMKEFVLFYRLGGCNTLYSVDNVV